MKEKMKLCCHVAMRKQEKNRRGVNKRSALCFLRPPDRKSIFLSCGLFAFGRNGKFTSLSQRMSKALSIVRAGGDLNPSEPNPSHSQIPDKGEIHERKRKQRRAPARYVR